MSAIVVSSRKADSPLPARPGLKSDVLSDQHAGICRRLDLAATAMLYGSTLGHALDQHVIDPAAHVAEEPLIRGSPLHGPGDLGLLASRCHGSPILMPSALATLVGAIAQPSLLLSTINGRLRSSGAKARSAEQ